jgi:hypothetical protein
MGLYKSNVVESLALLRALRADRPNESSFTSGLRLNRGNRRVLPFLKRQSCSNGEPDDTEILEYS